MRSARGDIDKIAAISVCRQLAVGACGCDGHHLRVRGGEMWRGHGFVAGCAHEKHPIFMMCSDDALKQRADLIAAEAKVNYCGTVVHRFGDAVGDVERVGVYISSKHIHRQNPHGTVLHAQVFIGQAA